MIISLRPGYKPPTTRDISGKLLDEANSEVDMEMKTICQQSFNDGLAITLCQDGWSSTSNHPIMGRSIFVNQKTYFLSSQECCADKKDSDYCAKLAIDAIEKLKADYEVDVHAVCTDNEPKMLATRRKIREKFPHILVYGCSAHYLNLVETAVTPNSVIKHIVEINDFFRNHHQPRGWLMEKENSETPQLPNATPWNSQLDYVNTYIDNWVHYNDIIREHPVYSNFNKIKAKVLNMVIFNDAKDLKDQLKTVGNVLDNMQSDTITLSGM